MQERWEIETKDNASWECRFYRNNFQIYYFACLSLDLAIVRLARSSHELMTHPVKITCRSDVHKKLIGSKVYYREYPAVVTAFDGECGKVLLRSDDPTIDGFPIEPWCGPNLTWQNNIWEDYLSPFIWWFRDTEES